MACESRLALNSSHLRNKLLQLKTESVLTDVVIKCHAQSVPSHRCVLSASSLFFKHVFTGSDRKRDDSELNLSGLIKYSEHLDEVVDFMYSGYITLNVDNFVKVVSLAKDLAVEDLFYMCMKYIDGNLNANNYLTLYLDLRKLVLGDSNQPEWCGWGNKGKSMMDDKVKTLLDMVQTKLDSKYILQEGFLKVPCTDMLHLLSNGLLKDMNVGQRLQCLNNWLRLHHDEAAYAVVVSFIDQLWKESQLNLHNQSSTSVTHTQHDLVKAIEELELKTEQKSNLIMKIRKLLANTPKDNDTYPVYCNISHKSKHSEIVNQFEDIKEDKDIGRNEADEKPDQIQNHYNSETDDVESIGEDRITADNFTNVKTNPSELDEDQETIKDGRRTVEEKVVIPDIIVKETVSKCLKRHTSKQKKHKKNGTKNKRNSIKNTHVKDIKSSRTPRGNSKTEFTTESAHVDVETESFDTIKRSKNSVSKAKDNDKASNGEDQLRKDTKFSPDTENTGQTNDNKDDTKHPDETKSELYFCRFCHKSFDKEKSLDRHVDTHKEKTEQCVFCGQMFARPYHVVVHMMKVHKGLTSHKCETCNEIIKHPKNIVRHAKMHRKEDRNEEEKFVDPKPNILFTLTEEGKKQFKCNVCAKTFTRKAGYQKHMLIHTGESPFKCTECDASFKAKYKLGWHVDRIHLGKEIKEYRCGKCSFRFCDARNFEKHNEKCEGKKIECEICQKKFLYQVELDRHVISHSDIRTHACDQCPRQFKHVQNLKAHVMLKHDNIDKITSPSVCDHCGKVLKNRNCLRRHLLTHTADRPYKCNVCPKAYTQSTGLEVHMRLHTGERPYQCEICSQMFVIKCNLDRHIQRHLGEKPHKCDKCDKAFVQITDLRRHKTAVHLLLKTFPCSYCGKKFALKKSVPVHERSHTGEKPFECPSCLKRFTTRSDMKRHEKTHMKDKFRDRIRPVRQDAMVEPETNRNVVTMNYAENYQMVDRMGFQTTCMMRNEVQPPQNAAPFMSAFSSGIGFY